MKNFKGFSLIEVLIFTAVLGLFFVAAISVATFNLRNMKIQEHKILATRYAEEAVEWLKQEKEDDWSVFSARDIGAGDYCLNSLNWDMATDCGDDYTLGTPSIFRRTLSVSNFGAPVSQINTTVTVAWKEGSDDFSIPVKTVFKLLE